MIQINKLFIKAFSPNEQLVMLQLLLNADENGIAEFSDRGISKATNIPYQQVRTIHQRWLTDGTISNAVANAVANANRCFITICDYDSYNVINIFSNAVSNAVTNALKEKETITDKDKIFPQTPLSTEKENNKEKEQEEKLSIEGKKKKFVYPDEFESDWVLYGRKGSKVEGYKRWKDLTDEEKEKMRKHIPYYLQSNDRQYLKDFEGYINQRLFESPVYKGSELLFDPVQLESPSVYSPLTDGILQWWDDKEKCLHFNGYIDMLDDGYTADNRPDGAKVKWQMYSWIWSATNKEWIKQ